MLEGNCELLEMLFCYRMHILPCLIMRRLKSVIYSVFNFILQILKQLEKESIKWTEEDDGGTIIIQVDVINPKDLSFYKK